MHNLGLTHNTNSLTIDTILTHTLQTWWNHAEVMQHRYKHTDSFLRSCFGWALNGNRKWEQVLRTRFARFLKIVFSSIYFEQLRCVSFLIFLPRSQNVFTLFSVSQQASDVEQRLLIVWKSCKQCRVHCRQIKLICCGLCTVRGQQSDVVALEACHRGGPCRTTAVARPCLAERPFAVLECGRRADEVQQAGSTVSHWDALAGLKDCIQNVQVAPQGAFDNSFAQGMGRCGVHAEISGRNAETLH